MGFRCFCRSNGKWRIGIIKGSLAWSFNNNKNPKVIITPASGKNILTSVKIKGSKSGKNKDALKEGIKVVLKATPVRGKASYCSRTKENPVTAKVLFRKYYLASEITEITRCQVWIVLTIPLYSLSNCWRECQMTTRFHRGP